MSTLIDRKKATALAWTVALLSGCGQTVHDGAREGDAGAEDVAQESPFGGSANVSSGGSARSGGGAGNEPMPEENGGNGGPAGDIGRALGSEPASLEPAGCTGMLESACETELDAHRWQLAILPTSVSALDATADQQVFAVCRTIYVEPRGGCVRALAVAESSVRRLAIVDDMYAVIQAESIRVVDAGGIVRAAWVSPKGGIWTSRLPPVVVSGAAIAFFAGDDLLELDPKSGVVRRLAVNPTGDVGELLAVGDDLVWSVGTRFGGCIPHFEATGVERFVRASGEITRESDLACDSIGTDGTRIYCAAQDHSERWLPGKATDAAPLEWYRVGPGLLTRGASLYRLEDPTTAVLTIENPDGPLLIAAKSAFYETRHPEDPRTWLYRATPP